MRDERFPDFDQAASTAALKSKFAAVEAGAVRINRAIDGAPCRKCTQPVLPQDRGSSSFPLGGRIHIRCEGMNGFINMA